MKPIPSRDREQTRIRRTPAIKALRKIESPHQALMDISLDAIVLLDRNGLIAASNDQFARLHGYKSKRELTGKSGFELIAPEERRRAAEIAGKARDAEPGEILKFEGLLLRKDGTRFWGEQRGKLILPPKEKSPFMLIVVRDITRRKAAEETARTALREKEALLREIHHRVKNNMQIISSLFSLQIKQTRNDECREILKAGQNRIRAMSVVHEKLYKASDLSRIDLDSYIKNLAVHLFSTVLADPGQVRLETSLDKVTLDINSAVPCGLILNELISNALRHGFPGGRKGKIRIGLKRGPEDGIVLQVADDGIGFPAGIDFRQSAGFGLQIVCLLVDQLEASIEMVRTNGTAFTVAFRELNYSRRI
jgi:PAS domain S-box-containing protein